MSTLQTPYDQMIEYPIGSGNLYRIPMDQEYVEPNTTYVSLLMHTSNGMVSAMIPDGFQVRGSVGAVVSMRWLSIADIQRFQQLGYNVYVESVDLEPVQVDTEAVTGERAEATPVQYELALRRLFRVHEVIPQGQLINPIQPLSRAAPVNDTCLCLFTNDTSCGQKLLFQLEKIA